MQKLQVNGTDLFYVEQGEGLPVVFVHGAWMDLRYWEPQRQAIAAQYRFVAYNLRYHGTSPWLDTGQHFSVATHSADLAAFIRRLNAGPVHLVGLSSGGRLVILVALGQPDLVRSLTVLEPPIDELLADVPGVQPVRDEWMKAFEPVREAALAGDAMRAAKLFFDLANNEGPDALDAQPETFRQMGLDNARTVPIQLLALRDRPAISRTVMAQSIPRSRLVVIPRATHLMSHQNPSAFNVALLDFLTEQ